LPNTLKTTGYAISSVSVLLLGIVSWRTAEDDPVMALCLGGGVLASLAGMVLRWLSYQVEEKR
jgi:hypothetical protein